MNRVKIAPSTLISNQDPLDKKSLEVRSHYSRYAYRQYAFLTVTSTHPSLSVIAIALGLNL